MDTLLLWMMFRAPVIGRRVMRSARNSMHRTTPKGAYNSSVTGSSSSGSCGRPASLTHGDGWSQIYVPFPLAPRPTIVVVIRTARTILDSAASAPKQVALINKDFAISRVSPMSDVVDLAVSESRFAWLLATLLAASGSCSRWSDVWRLVLFGGARRTSEDWHSHGPLGADRAHVSRWC